MWKYGVTLTNQTYLPITGRFEGQRHLFGKLVSDFWGSSPKIDGFWPHISPCLLPACSWNRENMSKYGVTLPNQTYLPITGRFGGQRHLFGKLVNDFWGSSPKIADFCPYISPLLLPPGTWNCENMSKYGVSLSNQTCLPMTGRSGGKRHVFGKLVSDFWGSNPKIADFLAPYLTIFATCRLMSTQNLSKCGFTLSNQTYQHMKGRLRA